MELDPVFIRALRLLHSTSKESGIQLKAMLDESIKMKKNPGLQPTKLSTPATQQSRETHVKESSERRNLDKLKRDLSELVPESKKPRIHSPARSSPGITQSSGGFSKSHTPSPTPTPTPPNHGDHPSGGNSSADELDLDVDLEGLNDLCCSICKTLNQGNGNKLMECHTCQNLYHQECHKPAISNQEAGDPRLVWNCSNCSGPPVPKVTHNSPKISKTSKVSTMQPLKSARPASGRSEISSSAVFKRTDTSKSHGSTSSSSSGGKPAGMAALAATYKGSSGSSSTSNLKGSSRSGTHGSSFGHSKTTTGSSSTSSSTSTIMSADKRLQLMKKKAAQRKK